MTEVTVQELPPVVQSEPRSGRADETVAVPRSDDAQLVESELLVEDVSIDGMCGVY
jgi:mycofactocin precursor